MTFQILRNGVYVDITPYIAAGGLEYQLSDIDSSDSGRTLDGVMHRVKIDDKEKWKVKCRPLSTSELSIVLQCVSEQYIQVRFLSPRYNQIVEKAMYVGDRTSSFQYESDRAILWSGLAFSLVER